jgi:hypothetical protein
VQTDSFSIFTTLAPELPKIITMDKLGNPKTTFNIRTPQAVYISGEYFTPNQQFNVYVVTTGSWSQGKPITNYIAKATISSDDNGAVDKTYIWLANMEGEVDIIVDYTGNYDYVSKTIECSKTTSVGRISKFVGDSNDGDVVLRWKADITIDTPKFNIYRAESEDGEYAKLNNTIIHNYTYRDTNVTAGKTYYYKLEDISISYLHGPIKVTVKITVPKETMLGQNYPNPFNPDTWIPYTLASKAHVIIKIYNITGQLVRELDLGIKEAGDYRQKDKAAYWDGLNEDGKEVASGVYFYQIHAGNYVSTKKMVVLK